MTAWTDDELSRIEQSDELEIAPLRRDGTPRNPVTIWVVRHGDDIFVRSYRGRGGSWFRAARASHQGRIRADGVDRDVSFTEEPDESLNDRIDDAYRSKYRRYSETYLPPMVAPEARAATIRLMPR